MKKITLEPGIELNIKEINNATTREINKSLPLESKVMTWGDEIYFNTDIKAPAKDATLDISVGDIAYWPQGKSLCIFFGSTPASSGYKPVPASEVVIIGKVELDAEKLREVGSGTTVKVE